MLNRLKAEHNDVRITARMIKIKDIEDFDYSYLLIGDSLRPAICPNKNKLCGTWCPLLLKYNSTLNNDRKHIIELCNGIQYEELKDK